jgi:hypothetical protein
VRRKFNESFKSGTSIINRFIKSYYIVIISNGFVIPLLGLGSILFLSGGVGHPVMGPDIMEHFQELAISTHVTVTQN